MAFYGYDNPIKNSMPKGANACRYQINTIFTFNFIKHSTCQMENIKRGSSEWDTKVGEVNRKIHGQAYQLTT
jgi:hypothetical protein